MLLDSYLKEGSDGPIFTAYNSYFISQIYGQTLTQNPKETNKPGWREYIREQYILLINVVMCFHYSLGLGNFNKCWSSFVKIHEKASESLPEIII